MLILQQVSTERLKEIIETPRPKDSTQIILFQYEPLDSKKKYEDPIPSTDQSVYDENTFTWEELEQELARRI